MRPTSPGPSWAVLPEPPSTSPTPTSPSDVDIRGDDDDINSNASPAKRKAVESPISIQRPPKVARFNENGRPTQISFDKWTNVPAPSSLTQPPKSAKKPRSSFLSQPTRTPPMRPDKGKNRASSRQSTSSLSDHISNMVEKQNQRYRRKETARKTNRTRRVTTSGLIRDIQKSSSGSEVSSAATRVRRASGKGLPRARPPLGVDIIELTDSSDSTRRRRVRNDEPIIILSSDADTPSRQPRPSQNSRSAGPRRPPPPEAEVICISDSENDTAPAPPQAATVPARKSATPVPAPLPSTAVPPIHELNAGSPLSPPGVVGSVEDDELLDTDPLEHLYLAHDDDRLLESAELRRQTEELFSCIILDFAGQDSPSPSALEGSNSSQDPAPPSPDSPTDPILPVSNPAIETSLNEVASVKITSPDDLARLESPAEPQISRSTVNYPSKTLPTTALATAKPSVPWKYTPPPLTNSFFARTLSYNAKVLSLASSNSPTSPAVIAPPAAVESSANILPKPLVDQQPSDALKESSSAVPSHSPATSPSRDEDMSVLPPSADKTVSSALPLPHPEICGDLGAPTSRNDQSSTRKSQPRHESPPMDVSMIIADIPESPMTVPPSSAPIPVPPRVQRTTTKLTLTELINQTREEHLRSHFVDLTDEISPSSGERPAPSTQPLHHTSTNAAGPVSASQPALSTKTRTPSIQEIRDLIRQRPSSRKPSTSVAATGSSASSVANPSSSSVASAGSPLVPSHSPPRSFTSNSTTSRPSPRQKNRPMGVASLEMYISPIADASQPASSSSSQKTRTPQSRKRKSYTADKFMSIITPTANASAQSPPLSPSERRRPKRVVSSSSSRGTGAGASAAFSSSPSAEIRVPLGALPKGHEEPGATSPSGIPLDQAIGVQNVRAEARRVHEGLSPQEDGMLQPEGIQGVTGGIGSLDLREESRSPKADMNLDQVHSLSLDNEYEGGVQAISVSAELMEHEELESLGVLADNVLAESVAEVPSALGKYREADEKNSDVDMRAIRTTAERTSGASDVSGEVDDQEECLAVLMQLEVSDGEPGDVEHPVSINSSRTASSHTSSRQTPESSRSTGPLRVAGDQGATSSIQQLEDGVESYLGGYPIVTWKSYSDAQRRLPFKYNLAKDLPHELQDRVNALPSSYRNSAQARVLFEAMIDEAMDDDLNAPPISVINDVTDEGAPPWEFVYTNQMWYGEGVPPPDTKNLKSCGCVGRCDPKSKTCSCAKRQHRHLKAYIEDRTIPKTWNGAPFVYDGKGCLQWFGLPIFECNAFCGCDEDCPNRVVQNGRRYVVNIKRTENKGWGIFNGPKKIPRGSFIGVYAGELLTVGEADRRGTLYNKFGRTYLFDIDFHHMGSEAVYSVDAYHAGNLTRFLNHSCDPNCEIQACYINEANIDKPMLTIFTVREVEPLEELSFSYMGQIDHDAVNSSKVSNDAVFAECHCGSANCLGVLFSGL